MLLLLEGGNMILGFLVPWTNEFHFIVFELPVAWVKNLKKTIIDLGQAEIIKRKSGLRNFSFINFEIPLYFWLKNIALREALPIISQR